MAVTLILMFLFVAFSYGEEETVERGSFKIREIENCGLEKFYGEEFNTEEQCEPWKAVVGFAYEFKLKEDMVERLIEKFFQLARYQKMTYFLQKRYLVIILMQLALQNTIKKQKHGHFLIHLL